MSTYLCVAGLAVITLAPIPAQADPCADLVKMHTLMAAATSFRETKVSPGGPTTETEFVAPDSFYTVTGGHEQVKIGTQNWLKADGHWTALKPSPVQPTTFAIAKAAVDNGTFLKSCSEAEVVDLGTKDGLHAIRLDSSKFGVQSMTYLRPDFLPAKIETTTRGKTYVATYSDWNAPLTIEAPK